VRAEAWLAGAVIVIAGLLAYANSFSGPFVFDDVPSIVENESLRQFWPPSALCPPSEKGVTVGGRPILNLSLAINYALGGASVAGYHATNLAIHLCAGLLLFGIVRRLGARLKPALPATFAFAAALLWVVHPLQTAAVTYVIQRAESLMGLFYLLTLYCFVRGAGLAAEPRTEDAKRPQASLRILHGATSWYALAVLACLCGMASKEVMASAPVIVLLVDRTFFAGSFGGAWQRRRGLYLALACSWLLLAALVAGAGARGTTAGFGMEATPWSYAMTQARAIPRYIALSFWPHPLVFDYGNSLVARPLDAAPGAALIVLLLGATLWALVRRPVWGLLGAFFFMVLAPSSSFIPVITQTVAEHRMYLPLAATLIASAAALRTFVGSRRLPAAALGVAAVLGWLTARRNLDYRSEGTLWADTAAKQPLNARAHCNLGLTFFETGRLSEAVAEYEAALRIDSLYAEARNNLATALCRKGDIAGAVTLLRTVIQGSPGSAKAHYNLGTLLAQIGELPEAAEQLSVATRLDPRDAGVHNNLGNVYYQLGRIPEAAAEYGRALQIDSDLPETHNNLGSALLSLGRPREALPHFEQALRLRPDYAKARENLERLRTAWPGTVDRERPAIPGG